MSFLRLALAIAAKDLRSELRSKETVNASLSFALVILLMFSFAFDPGSEQVREIAGGLLWGSMALVNASKQSARTQATRFGPGCCVAMTPV